MRESRTNAAVAICVMLDLRSQVTVDDCLRRFSYPRAETLDALGSLLVSRVIAIEEGGVISLVRERSRSER
ncbi:MAG: hypothetical protein AAF961_03590 [Planctomycetota bacterium]